MKKVIMLIVFVFVCCTSAIGDTTNNELLYKISQSIQLVNDTNPINRSWFHCSGCRDNLDIVITVLSDGAVSAKAQISSGDVDMDKQVERNVVVGVSRVVPLILDFYKNEDVQFGIIVSIVRLQQVHYPIQ